MPDLKQAFAAQAIGVASGNIVFLGIAEADPVALAFGYVAHLAFKGSMASGAGFGFVTRHKAETG